MSARNSTVEAVVEFFILVISALGLSLDPPVFIACLLLSSSGATLTRVFSLPDKRRPLAMTMGAGVFLGLVFVWGNDTWLNMPPQLAAALGGFLSVLLMPWLVRRFPTLADKAAGKYLGGQGKGAEEQ